MVEGACWARPASAAPSAGPPQTPSRGAGAAAQPQRPIARPAAGEAAPDAGRGATGAAPNAAHANSAGRRGGGAARAGAGARKCSAAGSLMGWLLKGKGMAAAAAGAAIASESSAARCLNRTVVSPWDSQEESATQLPGDVPGTARPARLEPAQCSPAASPVRHADASGVAVHAPVHAPFAVRVIWVSAKDRRQGIASRLLDAARSHLRAGSVITRQQLAFVQPTEAGCSLARAYTGSASFLTC